MGLETIYSTFCSAANSLSQLYSQSMNHQRLSFQAGERHGLEKLYQWIVRQQEEGSVQIWSFFTMDQRRREVPRSWFTGRRGTRGGTRASLSSGRQIRKVMPQGWPAGGFCRLREGGSEWVWGWSGGSRGIGRFHGGSNIFCRSLFGARPAASMEAAVEVVEEIGWWPQFFPDLLILLLNVYLRNVYLYLFVYFAYLMSGIRVVLDLCSSRIISVYLVTRALGSPSMVFVTPIWPEFSFGTHFLREFMPMGKIRVIFTLCVLVLCRIPRMVFVTPMWPEFSFGTPFLRELIFIFPIWYSDALQKIMLCKRIITVVGGFGPQSLVGDLVLVVYSLGVFCNFNGFVCLFHGTSLFRDLYVLLFELLSAVMDIVQFKD